MLKALGIYRREIKRIYFAKYLLFSACGALVGLGLAAAVQEPLAKQLRELYGSADQGVSNGIAALLASLLSVGIILLSVNQSLKKTDNLSVLDALFPVQKKQKVRMQYLLIGVMTAKSFPMTSVASTPTLPMAEKLRKSAAG